MNAPSFAPPKDFSTWSQDRKNKWFAHTAKAYEEARGHSAAQPPDKLRIPTKPATHSNRKPATDSDLKPAGVPI